MFLQIFRRVFKKFAVRQSPPVYIIFIIFFVGEKAAAQYLVKAGLVEKQVFVHIGFVRPAQKRRAEAVFFQFLDKRQRVAVFIVQLRVRVGGKNDRQPVQRRQCYRMQGGGRVYFKQPVIGGAGGRGNQRVETVQVFGGQAFRGNQNDAFILFACSRVFGGKNIVFPCSVGYICRQAACNKGLRMFGQYGAQGVDGRGGHQVGG